MKAVKRPTIKEIARKLRISPSTVSRALHDHPSIGLVTTMRVKKLAEELNYEPNQTAIFFKQRKTFTIAVVLPSLSEPFFSVAISEIENIANARDYTVIMGQTLDDEQRERRIIETLKAHRVDGIIVSMGKNTSDYGFIDILKNAGIPVVFFDCVPDLPNENRIVSNLRTGMLEAIATFHAKGHQKIGLINGPSQLPASKEREMAFRHGFAIHKLLYEEQYVVHSDLSRSGNIQAIEKLLSLPERPSALICFNDYVTLDVMKAVREKGLVINQDIYFISFANYPLWQHMDNPPMASIEQFPDKQGAKAAEVLFDLIDNKAEDMKPQYIVFESSLISHNF
ncbi:transcriptional regulator, LacI family [bacterium A37T11]|nr:transcriptional regulator, LacI family [bacterium A37T11]